MSGYASKREAMEVLKHTIETGWNSKAPSRDVSDYFMSKVFEESFYHRASGGWGQRHERSGDYHVLLAECLRPKARERLLAEAKADQARFYDMSRCVAEIPEGFTARDMTDLYEAARDRVDLLKGASS